MSNSDEGRYEQMRRDSTDSSTSSISDYRLQYQRFSNAIREKITNIILGTVALALLIFMVYLCVEKHYQFIEEEDDMLSVQYQLNKIRRENTDGSRKRKKWTEVGTRREGQVERLRKSIRDYNNDINQSKANSQLANKNELEKITVQLSNMNQLLNVTFEKEIIVHEIEAIKNMINYLKQKMPDVNKKEEPFKLNSAILQSNKEFGLIKNFFDDPLKIKGLQLLYRRSDHGKFPKDFHSMCDGISNTLTIIDTGHTILGGFTSKDWSGRGIFKTDPNAFLFNLNKNIKFPIRESTNAIYCSDISFPFFGNGDLSVLTDEIISGFPHSYQSHTEGNLNELINGPFSFPIQEIEVFQVIIF